MQCNIGVTDRNLRFILAFAMLGSGFLFGSWWGAVGLIPLVTAFVRWCPVYQAGGINSAGAGDPQ